MEGAVVKEIAERSAKPLVVGDVLATPAGWVLHDPLAQAKPGPRATAIQVGTLGALRDYLVHNRDGLNLAELIVHVEGPNRVTVGSKLDARCRDRELYITATTPDMTDGFVGKWLGIEDFVIGLQVRFCDAEQRPELLSVASHVRTEQSATAIDDGVSQTLEARGAALRSHVTLPNPVRLAAFRTFRDIPQPAMPFVFRAQAKEGNLPLLTLLEADGGTWRLGSVAKIRDWLVEHLPGGVAVLA